MIDENKLTVFVADVIERVLGVRLRDLEAGSVELAKLRKWLGIIKAEKYELEKRLDELEARIPAPEIVTRAPVKHHTIEFQQLVQIHLAAVELLEFPRPMGDSDRIKAWDALARAVRGNGL